MGLKIFSFFFNVRLLFCYVFGRCMFVVCLVELVVQWVFGSITHGGPIELFLVPARTQERERNILFNDALNTFYLRLYGVRHMVKDNSDSEKGNPLPPHRLLLSINSKGSFICTIPQTG